MNEDQIKALIRAILIQDRYQGAIPTEDTHPYNYKEINKTLEADASLTLEIARELYTEILLKGDK